MVVFQIALLSRRHHKKALIREYPATVNDDYSSTTNITALSEAVC